jgi:hypothetical protein
MNAAMKASMLALLTALLVAFVGWCCWPPATGAGAGAEDRAGSGSALVWTGTSDSMSGRSGNLPGTPPATTPAMAVSAMAARVPTMAEWIDRAWQCGLDGDAIAAAGTATGAAPAGKAEPEAAPAPTARSLAWEQQLERLQRERRQVLATSQDPRVRAFALELGWAMEPGSSSASTTSSASTQPLSNEAQSRAWSWRVAELASLAETSGDVAVLAAAVTQCQAAAVAGRPNEPACSSLTWRRWAAVEPDNAAPWIVGLAEAQRRGDTSSVENARAKIVSMRRLDDYHRARVAAWAKADLEHHAATGLAGGHVSTDAALKARALQAMVEHSLFTEGTFLSRSQELLRVCSARSIRDANNRETCVRVARWLETHEDSLLGRQLARGLLKSAGGCGDPQDLDCDRRADEQMGLQHAMWRFRPFGALSDLDRLPPHHPARTHPMGSLLGPDPCASAVRHSQGLSEQLLLGEAQGLQRTLEAAGVDWRAHIAEARAFREALNSGRVQTVEGTPAAPASTQRP